MRGISTFLNKKTHCNCSQWAETSIALAGSKRKQKSRLGWESALLLALMRGLCVYAATVLTISTLKPESIRNLAFLALFSSRCFALIPAPVCHCSGLYALAFSRLMLNPVSLRSVPSLPVHVERHATLYSQLVLRVTCVPSANVAVYLVMSLLLVKQKRTRWNALLFKAPYWFACSVTFHSVTPSLRPRGVCPCWFCPGFRSWVLSPTNSALFAALDELSRL